MPSSYTANGGIELPANGEQSGTWGETVNDNMSIIDRLTNGVGSISLAGTTHTLTTNNGSLSEGQYKVLLLGGAPSGTNTITVTPNTGQHIYIVKNSSGQTATFTQGSGGNVSVLNGTAKILATNGAGAGAQVIDITAAILTDATLTSPTLTSPTLASVVTITGGTQSWTVTAAGTNLTFAYNGTNKMRIDSSGNFTVTGNVNTVGTIS
jgi:hypothetical protein